jgi:hypothetical protein
MKNNIFTANLIMTIVIASNIFAAEAKDNGEYTWENTKVAQNIKKQYGSVEMIENGLKIIAGTAYAGLDLYIVSKLDLLSIEIYEDTNPSLPVATYEIQKGSIIDYQITIKTKNSGYVTVIGKERNGTLHIAKKWNVKCRGDCEGGGG